MCAAVTRTTAKAIRLHTANAVHLLPVQCTLYIDLYVKWNCRSINVFQFPRRYTAPGRALLFLCNKKKQKYIRSVLCACFIACTALWSMSFGTKIECAWWRKINIFCRFALARARAPSMHTQRTTVYKNARWIWIGCLQLIDYNFYIYIYLSV